MGLVPKTTKAEVKVFGGFSMVRIFGIILSAGVGIMLGIVLPYDWLQIVLSAFFVILFLILSGKAPSNPKQNFARGMSNMFRYFLSRKKFYGDTSKEYTALMERRDKHDKSQERKKSRKKIQKKRKKY